MRAHVMLSFKDDSTEVEIAGAEATDSGVGADQMADPDEDVADDDDGGVVLEETEVDFEGDEVCFFVYSVLHPVIR